MEVWNTFQRQITTLWQQWSLQQRVFISAAAVLCLGAVIGTLVWATQPEYVVLARAASSHEAADIVSKLEVEQIDFNLSTSGMVIEVSRGDLGKARHALKDVLDPLVGDEDTAAGGGMFPDSPDQEADRRNRTLEARIARTIEQIKAIRTATVHINQPEASVFVVDETPPSASVIVTPATGTGITSGVAQSVILTLAGAVKGLDPENIHLTDINGRRYSTSDGIGGDMAGRFEYQQRLELKLAHNAKSMLDRWLGEGKSEVKVTADIDFRQVSRTEKIIDPEIKAKLSETTDKVESEGSTQSTGGGPSGNEPSAGPAGRAAQVAQSLDPPGGGGNKYKRDTKTVEYDNPSTSETTHINPGTINRITVAAIVDLGATGTEDSPDGAEAPASTITVEQVEALVQQAVGFDAERGDQITVATATLNVPVIEPVAPGFMPLYEQYRPLIEAGLVGLGATIAFFIAVLSVRKLKPVLVQEDTAPSLNREDYERMAELSQKARANPEVAARIISAWLGQEPPADSPETEVQRKSRAA